MAEEGVGECVKSREKNQREMLNRITKFNTWILKRFFLPKFLYTLNHASSKRII